MTEPKKTQLRTLGAPGGPSAETPKRSKTQAALAAKAQKVLRAEFDRAMGLKAKLADEAGASSEAKGRSPAEKLRSLVASLEGMSRFAIQMGLLTPAENRAIFAEYMGKGLYEGWR
ncbi:MAG: hypothetical protein ACREQQ_12775 [Candidatus Binatia bacterium]